MFFRRDKPPVARLGFSEDEFEHVHAASMAGRYWWDYGNTIIWDERSCEIFGIEPQGQLTEFSYAGWSGKVLDEKILSSAQISVLESRRRMLPYQNWITYEIRGKRVTVFSVGTPYVKKLDDEGNPVLWLRGYNIEIRDTEVEDNIDEELERLGRLTRMRERTERFTGLAGGDG